MGEARTGQRESCIRLREGCGTPPLLSHRRSGDHPQASIDGIALKSNADARRGVDRAARRGIPLYDITTETGDFIANGVVSHNCFARPTHNYLDFNAGRDFEREIVVKVNVPERVRADCPPSWKRRAVALGTNTDPYQWVEGRYELMPGIWEAMRDTRERPARSSPSRRCCCATSTLMKELAERPFTANLSIPTIDEKAWRATEPHTPIPAHGSRRWPS